MKKENKIINKIKIDKLYIYSCFLCVRKRKILVNFLLDEGIKVITQKLDILNIFRRIYLDEKIHKEMDNKYEFIEMSDNCKIKFNIS